MPCLSRSDTPTLLWCPPTNRKALHALLMTSAGVKCMCTQRVKSGRCLKSMNHKNSKKIIDSWECGREHNLRFWWWWHQPFRSCQSNTRVYKHTNIFGRSFVCWIIVRLQCILQLESTIPFRVYVLLLLDSQAFVDVHVHFLRLTAPVTWVNDRCSDDHNHVGTVVIRCRSRAGRIPDFCWWLAVGSWFLWLHGPYV